MRKIGLALSLISAGLFVATTGAQAQAVRTWVSGVGDDVNPCSRTAPCKTFAGAISKTAASGEIDTLDPGGFGTVSIFKAITIADEGVGEGGVAASGTTGVTVNAGANDVVVLRGLQIDGAPTTAPGINGVRFIAGRALLIQNCVIRNFITNGYGVTFTPSSGTVQLFVDNTSLENNGTGGTGGGIFVQPTASPTVTVSITNSQVSNNGFGIRTDSSAMTGGGISTAIADSQSNGNANAGIAAITATTGGIANAMTLARATVAHNNVGLNANGSAAGIHIGASMLFDNVTGVKANNGGVVDSFGGNQFYNNPTGPGPSLTIIGPF